MLGRHVEAPMLQRNMPDRGRGRVSLTVAALVTGPRPSGRSAFGGLIMARHWLRNGGIAILLVSATAAAARSFAQHPSASPASLANPAVPVAVVQAARQDVPVFTEGVGTIQALNAVLVRSRVDGTLMQVAVKEGQEVKPGDLIATIDPRPFQATLDQAMAKKQQDVAALNNANLDLTRFVTLERQDFASRQQADTQKALVAQDIAAVAGDQAMIEAAQLNLAYCYITSPIPGRVGLRLVDPGNLVHATDTTGIVTITQDHPIAATFTLPQEELPRVMAALAKGPTPVVAYPSDDSTPLDTGSLLTPNNQIDTTTGTVTLKAEFPNPGNTLWPGQFINAHLRVGIDQNAVTVPQKAVQHGPDGLYVYVVKPDATAAIQPISVGYQDDGQAVITKGLNGGESVVVDGASRLDAGTRVAATNAPHAG
jgi:membrane fusion protein, multidrug efflux system